MRRLCLQRLYSREQLLLDVVVWILFMVAFLFLHRTYILMQGKSEPSSRGFYSARHGAPHALGRFYSLHCLACGLSCW